MADMFGVLYAMFLAIGGAMGYSKSGNMNSLAAGLVTGSIAIYGTYQETAGVSLCLSTFLVAFMGYRYMMKQKYMPDAVTGFVSFLMTLLNGMNYYYES